MIGKQRDQGQNRAADQHDAEDVAEAARVDFVGRCFASHAIRLRPRD